MLDLQSVLDIALPLIAFFLTVLVGMDLTWDHFRKLKHSNKALIAGTFGQYLLPLGALVVLKIVRPDPEIAAGLILISVSPGGGISNYYTYLARANTALSVVLTTVSCVMAAVTMPLLLRAFEAFLGQRSDFHIPLNVLFGQLLFLLIVPVILGFSIRRYSPWFVERFNGLLRLVGLLALSGLIGFILYQTWSTFLQAWGWILVSALCFVGISMTLGWLLSIVLRLDSKDAITLMIEYGVRNLSIPTVIAAVFLRKVEFATFGAFYFLMEALLILSSIMLFRRLTR